jgi:hypothetical protein
MLDSNVVVPALSGDGPKHPHRREDVLSAGQMGALTGPCAQSKHSKMPARETRLTARESVDNRIMTNDCVDWYSVKNRSTLGEN